MLGIMGACPVKIMIFDGRFLLTNLDSTSALHLALNLLIWALGGISQGSLPV